MAQVDDVATKIRVLIKEHFRLMRDPGLTMSPEARKQLTNGVLYGISHTLEIVEGHPNEVELAADLRLLINRDQIDEANAKVDAL